MQIQITNYVFKFTTLGFVRSKIGKQFATKIGGKQHAVGPHVASAILDQNYRPIFFLGPPQFHQPVQDEEDT